MKMKQSKVWILIKYFLSIDFYVFISLFNFNKPKGIKVKRKKGSISQGIISFIAIGYLWFIFLPVIVDSLSNIWNTGARDAAIMAGVVVMFIFTTVLTLAQAFSFVEKNNESEMLLSLPIKGKDIITSRIAALGITFFFSLFIIIAIALTITGINLKLGILNIIAANLGIIMIAFISTFTAGIIILGFGRLIRVSKFFNRFSKVIYGLFLIGILVLYMFFVTNISSGNAIGLDVNSQFDGIYEKLSTVFFALVWAKNMVVSTDLVAILLNTIIGLAICVVVYLLFSKLASTKYLEILRANNVVGKESKQVINKRKTLGLGYKKKSHFRLIFEKEIVNITTNPTYILQVIPSDIMVLIFAGAGFMAIKDSGESVKAIIEMGLAYVSEYELIIFALGLGCALGLFAGIDSLVTSSVARDGKAFWILASAPIKPATQIFGRVIGCQIIHFVFYLVIVLGSMLIYVFNPLVYIALILGIIITLLSSGLLNMILGVINPNFDWKSAKEAINSGAGSLNVFIGIIVNYALYALIAAIFYLGSKHDIAITNLIIVNFSIVALVGIVAFFIDNYLLNRLIKKL